MVPYTGLRSGVTVANLRKNVPTGKFRVIRVDEDGEANEVGEYYDQAMAFADADKRNSKRTMSSDDVCGVFNDAGELIRGHQVVADVADGLGLVQ